ncbi:hypothetical protein [Methylobacterium fujisawaense]|uniref:Uncharacterized protein n=1 Tax=Methylobacterium fujisawaense TaxID=107400 RepID=A0ABR6DBF7_9HYPH|nr:hypothetical protein [Methylobacterium fujisawaense]MBA9063130.1 hypothetical protein [Methylobacterium fujisawaense]
MATNVPPASPSVREYRRQESQYVRLTVTFANGAFVLPASLPAGALITSLLVLVEAAFSAGASLTLGSAPGGSDLAAAGDTAVTAAGVKRIDTATLKGRLAADTPIYGTIAGAPAAGVATIVLHYAPNNDG